VTTARHEPLIWLQLLGAAALPLEALLLLLLLAGADPGPVPALERLLAWAIGALIPALVLWRYPADPLSLLVLQAPLRGRSAAQRRLSGVPPLLLPSRLAAATAALLVLPGLWWLDTVAALAGPMALLPDANRLVDLLLAIPLLAVMVWQLQQWVQGVGLLLRPSRYLDSVAPPTVEQIESQRLCLGLPLLLLEPLRDPSQASAPPAAVTVPPEQPTEDPHSANLDQQVD